MNIQAEISWIQAEISKIRDPELINAFKSLLKYREKQVKTDWWNEITAKEKSEIEQGTKEIKNGNFLTHKEVMANPRKWH